MAVRHICDGCNAEITGEPVKAGFVLRVDYCPTCAEAHAAYQRAVDALHERLSSAWTTELRVLRESFRERLARLPDDNVTEASNAGA